MQMRGQQVTEHILIGTLGTMLDWVIKLRAFDPRKIKMFVLDDAIDTITIMCYSIYNDADVLIDTQGQQDQIVQIHKYSL